MLYVPRDYAPEVVSFIIDTPRCNVWLDPGLGKTSISLTAFDFLWIAGSNKFPVLIIAPLRVARSVWSDEVAKWDCFSDYAISQIVGNPKERLKALNTEAQFYTINFENLPWLIDLFSERSWPFKSIVCDESTKLKGFRLIHGAKRASALAKAAKFTSRWVNLTGTPAPNGLIDLWGPQWFVDAGARLGTSQTDFKRRWFDEDKYANTIKPRDYAEEQIMALLADVTISLRAGDCMELDEWVSNPIVVDLPRKAMAMYREFEKDLCIEVDGVPVLEAKTAADLSLKCLQLASGAFYRPDTNNKLWDVIHDAKIEAVKDLLIELAGNPLLVAYHFKHDLARLLEHVPGAKHLKTKQDEDDWNAGKILVGIVHPGSAGHGLNLQHGGHNIAFFSHWWNLEHYLQVIERIGPVRQLQSGYDRRVMVHHIIARGTMDETVMIRRETKRSVQDLIRERVRNVRTLL